MRSKVSLLQGATVLVIGEAFNPGIGTWIARDAAADAIVNSAIDAFDRELGQACAGEPNVQHQAYQPKHGAR
jgi:hypothetical protein